jgi:ribosome-binding factor A
MAKMTLFCGALLLRCLSTHSFQVPSGTRKSVAPTQSSTTSLSMASYYSKTQGRSSPRDGREKSKRQERVGHLVRTELSKIIHRGNIKGDADYLEDELRQRISVIHANISPDLRQARITVSIRKSVDENKNAAVDKRRAYSWLVQNTKPIRHTLAQNLSYMKSVPNLTFAQADVAAAVDVMYLIDKVAQGGYKRETVGEFGGDDDSLPRGMVGGIDFDEDEEDIEWMDEDDDFFLQDDEKKKSD